MSEETTITGLHRAQSVTQPTSKWLKPHVLLVTHNATHNSLGVPQQSLSPREIERICRCFIRLIAAKEMKPDAEQEAS